MDKALGVAGRIGDASFCHLTGWADPMHHWLDPRVLIGQPLRLRSIGTDDYRVTIRGKMAGRILKTMRGGNQQVWLWSLTGPCCAGAGIETFGESDQLDAAKRVFRMRFEAWLDWAIRQNGDVTRHE